MVAEQGRRPFDLSSGEPFRARLFRLADSDHILQLVVHHIVVDEWSKVVLFDELSALYQAYCRRPSLAAAGAAGAAR